MLFFTTVPVADLFSTFIVMCCLTQDKRKEMVKKDIKKFKNCLKITFICLDRQREGKIDFDAFQKFFNLQTNNRIYENNVKKLYLLTVNKLSEPMVTEA